MKCHTAIILPLLCAFSKAKPNNGPITAEINDYADDFLKRFSTYIIENDLISTSVNDAGGVYGVRILFVPIYVEMSLKNGELTGLENFKRFREASVRYHNKKMSVTVPLQFSAVTVDYDYKAKLLGIGPSGGVKGTIKDLKVTVKFDINCTDIIFDLNSFSVDGSGFISTQFNGFILTDFILQVLTEVVVNLFRDIIYEKIEESMHQPLEEFIKNANEFVGNFLN